MEAPYVTPTDPLVAELVERLDASQREAWAEEYEDNVGLGLDHPLDDILDRWGWQPGLENDFVERANRELSATEEHEMASLEWVRLMDASCTD